MFVKYESQEEIIPITHSGMENKQKYHELLLETNIKITICTVLKGYIQEQHLE